MKKSATDKVTPVRAQRSRKEHTLLSRSTRRTHPYHHGDVEATLLRLAEEMLEREGVEGLSLRALARDAGISHAAPKHHFGDLTGLLSELAALGYQALARALEEAECPPSNDRRKRMVALGHAYVAQARVHPGMFRLMFRNACLDFSRPALRDASRRSRAIMFATIDKGVEALELGEPPSAGRHTEVLYVGAWSLVHGFAVLLIDGRLDRALKDTKMTWEEMLDAVFSSAR